MKRRKNDPRRDDARNLSILNRALAGERHVDICKDFGVTANRISQIVQREKWHHGIRDTDA